MIVVVILMVAVTNGATFMAMNIFLMRLQLFIHFRSYLASLILNFSYVALNVKADLSASRK